MKHQFIVYYSIITKDHIAMHTISFNHSKAYFQFFGGMAALCITLCGQIKGKRRDVNVMYPWGEGCK